MARAKVLTLAILVVSSLAPAGAANASEEPRYYLMRARTGPEGARDIAVYALAGIKADGSEALVIIGGNYVEGIGGSLYGFPWGPVDGGQVRISTTAGAGSHGYSAGGRQFDTGVDFGCWFLGYYPPNAELGCVVATLAGRLNDIRPSQWVASAGSVIDPRVETGDGVYPLRAVEPGHEGVAVSAGPAVAGSSSHREHPTTGMVGSYMIDHCHRCELKWRSPDGRTGTAEKTGVWPAVVGDSLPIFYGPAGEWSFDFCCAKTYNPFPGGVMTNSTYGYYLELGEVWQYYSKDCIRNSCA